MSMRMPVSLGLSALFVVVACGDGVDPEERQPAPASRSTSSGSPAADGDSSSCVDGDEQPLEVLSNGCFSGNDHRCGDVARPAVCKGGSFVCPSGTLRGNECWCFGSAAPSCTCNAGAGWVCPTGDGGA